MYKEKYFFSQTRFGNECPNRHPKKKKRRWLVPQEKKNFELAPLFCHSNAMSKVVLQLDEQLTQIEQDLELVTTRFRNEFDKIYKNTEAVSINPISISARIKKLHREFLELLISFEHMIKDKHQLQEYIHKKLLGDTNNMLERALRKLGQSSHNWETANKNWESWNQNLRKYFQLYASADALEDNADMNSNLELETMRADAFISVDNEGRKQENLTTSQDRKIENQYPFTPIAKSAFQRLPRNLRTKASLEELNLHYEKVWKIIVSKGGEPVPTTQILKHIGEDKKDILDVLRGLAVVSFTMEGWILTKKKSGK